MLALVDRLPGTAAVTDGLRELSARELWKLSTRRKGFHGLSIALKGDAIFLFKWLTLLDGVVGRIVLVPQSVDQTLVDRILEAGSVDWLVCEKESGGHDWSDCKLYIDADLSAPLPFPLQAGSGDLSGDGSDVVTQWVLATSGTTRDPKLVAHTLATLTRSMNVEQRFAQFRWGLTYDVARFAGIQVFLQSLLSGATLLAPVNGLKLSGQVQWLGKCGCSALSATPTLWRKMLMSGGLQELSLRQITMGGEIADAATINALSLQFPDARLTHVYASTEVGVGFAVHDRQAGFPASWLKTGVRGVQLRIGNNDCLWVAPGGVEQTYLGASEQVLASEGWIDTGDVVRLEGERVYFCGRLNGSMNIGGNKVFPEEVENVILGVGGVTAVLVRARPSSVMGSLVEALIVLDSACPTMPSDVVSRIKYCCRERLEAFKVPAFIRVVDEIDISAAGKISRNR